MFEEGMDINMKKEMVQVLKDSKRQSEETSPAVPKKPRLETDAQQNKETDDLLTDDEDVTLVKRVMKPPYLDKQGRVVQQIIRIEKPAPSTSSAIGAFVAGVSNTVSNGLEGLKKSLAKTLSAEELSTESLSTSMKTRSQCSEGSTSPSLLTSSPGPSRPGRKAVVPGSIPFASTSQNDATAEQQETESNDLCMKVKGAMEKYYARYKSRTPSQRQVMSMGTPGCIQVPKTVAEAIENNEFLAMSPAQRLKFLEEQRAEYDAALCRFQTEMAYPNADKLIPLQRKRDFFGRRLDSGKDSLEITSSTRAGRARRYPSPTQATEFDLEEAMERIDIKRTKPGVKMSASVQKKEQSDSDDEFVNFLPPPSTSTSIYDHGKETSPLNTRSKRAQHAAAASTSQETSKESGQDPFDVLQQASGSTAKADVSPGLELAFFSDPADAIRKEAPNKLSFLSFPGRRSKIERTQPPQEERQNEAAAGDVSNVESVDNFGFLLDASEHDVLSSSRLKLTHSVLRGPRGRGRAKKLTVGRKTKEEEEDEEIQQISESESEAEEISEADAEAEKDAEEERVACPICSEQFLPNEINEHANECAESSISNVNSS
ncbi:unnamed protein product [Cyprideis torosa]|uniref:Uncharacterized protein n=1 Tax=Cyprideis torosa TaxID=163714 RepID=A0A7R8ZSF7_9CRUS|nr:unnamed protein product [Cyprideis torosa]CAG0901540.1 unnamed protein product [Cyprideis torosa]